MIKAAIYDMDNVIVDSITLHYKATDETLKPYNVKMDDLPQDLLASCVGMRIIDILTVIVNHFNLSVDPAELELKRKPIFLKFVREEMQALPGLKQSLDFFKQKKIKIALGTSGIKDYVDIVLDKFQIRDYFDVIVDGEDVSKGKPDPETYLIACEKLNLKPEECVVIEDAFEGIKAARTAGCKCIGIPAPKTVEQDLSEADVILNSLADINQDVINSLNAE